MLEKLAIFLLKAIAKNTKNDLDDAVVWLVIKLIKKEKITEDELKRAVASVSVDDRHKRFYNINL